MADFIFRISLHDGAELDLHGIDAPLTGYPLDEGKDLLKTDRLS